MGTKVKLKSPKSNSTFSFKNPGKKSPGFFCSVGLTKYSMRSIIDLSFIQSNLDASKSRNGAVHPMLELLFYSSLTCQQADTIMLKMKANENLSNAFKVELIETVKESTPECIWDAHD